MTSNVVHLTSAHAPGDTRVFHKECVTLAAAGYRVTLVAPGDTDDHRDGVDIVAIPPARTRRERVTRIPGELWRRTRELDPDLVHFHDPDLLPLGVLLARKGRTVVFDSHEDVVRQLGDRSWIPAALRPLVQRVVGSVERQAVRRLAAVISAEPGGAGRFPPDRTTIVQNFPLRREFDVLDSEPYADREPVVFYVGDITRARGARQMVDAIGRLPESLGARFVLAGRINEPGLRDELEASPGWLRTDYVGPIDRDTLRHHLGRARIGIVLMQPTPQYVEATQPVKLFEYLGAGIPVVASDFASWRPFVTGIGAGLQVDPTSPQAAADAIATLLAGPAEAEAMGEAGRRAVWSRWTWDTEANALLDLYGELLAR